MDHTIKSIENNTSESFKAQTTVSTKEIPRSSTNLGRRYRPLGDVTNLPVVQWQNTVVEVTTKECGHTALTASALILPSCVSTIEQQRKKQNALIPRDHSFIPTLPSASDLPRLCSNLREGVIGISAPQLKTITHFPADIRNVLYRGPVSKRLRWECSETVSSHTLDSSQSVDESEIDRRPFVSKLASDIVRAAFADRIPLEELLVECRRTDFAISALDRSPVDRMMEATDYIVGIMAYEQIRERKDCFRVSDFLANQKQPNLTADMLTTLADWFIEVQEIFSLNHETIHLAWGILYAYLSRGRVLARREIQLMACASLMIACKHEENRTPRLQEFMFITDGAYKREDFLEAERNLLITLDFAVHRPNPYMFLRRYARVLDAQSGLIQYMSRFLLEAGMHSHTISIKRESRKAAAVLWLARVVLRNPSYVKWTRRADVRQLHQFIRSNPVARRFYDSCPRAELTRPPVFQHQYAICPDSGALDLSNGSSCSLLSRTPSFTKAHLPSPTDCSVSWTPSVLTDQDAPTNRSSVGRSGLEHSLFAATACTSSPATSNHAASMLMCDPRVVLDSSLRAELEAMRSEEDQRAPYWPPILEHITGYKESELIPLAVRYHTIALRLIAEVARGGRLADERRDRYDSMIADTSDLSRPSLEEEETNSGSASSSQLRCTSPGGHQLRRQTVCKYCSDAFLNVADAYPQLSFENFVPYFPSVQCPDACTCFVCVNLVRRIA